jgi:hypothetical protein
MMARPVSLTTPPVAAQSKNVTVGTPEPHALDLAFPSRNTIDADNDFSGPGFLVSDFESNRIIGNSQFQAAQRVMNGGMSPVQGTVRSVHVYMNM